MLHKRAIFFKHQQPKQRERKVNAINKKYREIFSPSDISAMVAKLAAKISHDYEGREPVILGVLTGAFIFAADLVRELTCDFDVDFVRVESYGNATSTSGSAKITMNSKLDLTGRDIIVVEEIIDSGITLNALLKSLKDSGAKSIALCTLVNKTARREVEVEVDYVGFTLDDGFLVGYGLDLAEKLRGLPAIMVPM
jgi:hypoxanthine phosphoribosyltransferase